MPVCIQVQEDSLVKVYSIDEIVEVTPFSRSGLYEAIKKNRLVARKDGRKTIILETDWNSFLNSLPPIDPAKKSSVSA